MRNKRLYAFIIANHAVSRVWRVSIPYPVLVFIGIFAIIGVIVAVSGGYKYARMALKVMDYDHLLSENDAFRSENHRFRIQTAQLGEKIDFLETLSTRLKALLLRDGLGGVGGYSKDSFTQPLPHSAGTLQSIDSYNRRVDSLETRFREAQEDISAKALIDAARPSIPPVNGYVNQGMGRRTDPFNPGVSEYHRGVDISAPFGTRVFAPADGIVIYAAPREGYGNVVVIDHKFGITTRYAHLSKMNVRPGQRVSRYDVIGFVGSSGRSTAPHLHFEVWFQERAVNPINFMYSADRDSKPRPQVALTRR
jgi:murein DD-endopeptidase MepM/ murein hydrolase activator NlpD